MALPCTICLNLYRPCRDVQQLSQLRRIVELNVVHCCFVQGTAYSMGTGCCTTEVRLFTSIANMAHPNVTFGARVICVHSFV